MAVERVMSYLKGTIDKRITYHREASELIGYCDANHEGNIDTELTTFGYVLLFQGAAISWCSKSKEHNTFSGIESEYAAMVDATKELIWLKQLERELFPSSNESMVLHCSNKSAMENANNESFFEGTTCTRKQLKYLHQRINEKEIELRHVTTHEMLADALTKGVPKIKLDYFCRELGLN